MMLLLSELTLYYFDLICSLNTISQNAKQPRDSEGIVENWADKVAKSAKKSQAKPSVPPSIRTTGM
jgi:hypothetical protein